MNKRNRELHSALTTDRLNAAIADPADEKAFKDAMEAMSKELELERIDSEEKANKKAIFTEIGKVAVPVLVTVLTISLNYVFKSKYANKLYGMERGDDGVIFTGLAAKGLSDMNEFSRK
jgi:hypothetical protein